VSDSPTRKAPSGRGRGGADANWATLVVALAAAVGVLQFYRPSSNLLRKPFAAVPQSTVPSAAPSPNAFGRSGEVKVRFALPGERLEYPLDVQGDPSQLSYQWVRLADAAPADSARTLSGAEVVAPGVPGFYQLALVKAGERRVVDGLTLTVLVPFTQKADGLLNGYAIGTYLSERLGTKREAPLEGFVEVRPEDLQIPITKHLTLADFVAHDGQGTWPRYTAVNPRLLDKLELVMAKIGSWRGVEGSDLQLSVDVHSGFRPPTYNRLVKRAAKDSRHQYGDAADVAIDANGDGRFTAIDTKLVAQAVEEVEQDYPDLAGGVGLYTSRRYNTPYVHIDARGKRARWRG
jgi:uncharacterized protein YcbK (DUF882 family)